MSGAADLLLQALQCGDDNTAREAAREYLRGSVRKGTALTSPQQVADYLQDIAAHDQEHFVLIGVDCRQRVIERCTISVGLHSEVAANPREVFIAALRMQAAYIILAHNHPSGDPTPSEQDIRLTLKFKLASDIMGIPLVDHIVVAQGSFRSIREVIGEGAF